MNGFLPGITKVSSRPAYGDAPGETDQWVVYINTDHIVSMKHGPDESMIVTLTDGSIHTCSLGDAEEWGVFDRPHRK